METVTALLTPTGSGAIATIGLFGKDAKKVLTKIFKPASKKNAELNPPNICLGHIYFHDKIIDQVTIACQQQNFFTINCHGNPIITADIIALLENCSVKPLTTTQFIYQIQIAKTPAPTTIEIEATLATPDIKTISGTRIVLQQAKNGLNNTIDQWLSNKESITPEQIKIQAAQILQNSKKVKPLIFGPKIILIGPPNSGKSTLLNQLAGTQKAIVSNIKGTTLDYVTAQCEIAGLVCNFIDTAGLDEQISKDQNQTTAQQNGLEITKNADLIILVLDSSDDNSQLNQRLKDFLQNCTQPIITVFNKSDLPQNLDKNTLPIKPQTNVSISALDGTNIEKLLTILRNNFTSDQPQKNTPIAFTARQNALLNKIINENSKEIIFETITELLKGRLCI